MKEGPRGRFNNLIVPIRVGLHTYTRPRAGCDKISTYFEPAKQLLKMYAINVNVARATNEISTLRKMPKDSAEQFADAIHLKAVSSKNSPLDEWLKKFFFDVLSTATFGEVGMFWKSELVVNLSEIAPMCISSLNSSPDEPKGIKNLRWAFEWMILSAKKRSLHQSDVLKFTRSGLSPSPFSTNILLEGKIIQSSWTDKNKTCAAD